MDVQPAIHAFDLDTGINARLRYSIVMGKFGYGACMVLGKLLVAEVCSKKAVFFWKFLTFFILVQSIQSKVDCLQFKKYSLENVCGSKIHNLFSCFIYESF